MDMKKLSTSGIDEKMPKRKFSQKSMYRSSMLFWPMGRQDGSCVEGRVLAGHE